MGSLEKLIRTHLRKVTAYSSARDEFEGQADVYLDANENSLGSAANGAYHRYPDPHHSALRQKWSVLKEVAENQIFFGNGSDEPIDLLIRLLCEPQHDHIITMPPTYGMYKVSAAINAVENVLVPLTKDFQIDIDSLQKKWNEHSKIIFLCSPNNPSGNTLNRADVLTVLKNFPGIVILDEAYADFSSEPSWIGELENYPRLVVLQTLSKAWGMAAIRVGIAMGDPYIISMLERIKPPYNISEVNQQLALEALNNESVKNERVKTILDQRARLERDLTTIPQVYDIVSGEGNFLLVRFNYAEEIFAYLTVNGVIVRNRTKEMHCENGLRITVGTEQENDQLMKLLEAFQPKNS